MAPLVGHLVGIESSPSACEDFVTNLDEFENVVLYEAPAEDVFPHLETTPDIVLVDPPRAGISRDAMDSLLNLASPLLVYVSCDPATLARDSRPLISAGYHLAEINPFDLFPLKHYRLQKY